MTRVSNRTAVAAALAAAGDRVFNGVGGCIACHGLGQRAPNLRADHDGMGTIGARCMTALGVACKEYLFASLTSPGDSIVPGFQNIMPDMRRQLPEDQIWAAVAYLQSLGGEITVTGADKQAVGQFAARVRAVRPPEPYNGKGIKYVGEVVIRKQGKVFGS